MTTSDPIVSVRQGKLRGKTCKDFNGKDFYSFQGIPYAKPPLGTLRFKDPQPPEKWEGVRDATQEGEECYSKHMITNTNCGSEDCLTLNVYTPLLPIGNTLLKPVMMWIHGGAFTRGSSKTELYGPEFLVAQDIVLVTINYRLGVLGFLALEDTSLGVPGNAGLKDTVMALKWIQSNISKFSGNPKNVTIFGQSAGGAAVHYLVLSPMAKGLFHKAILQSGSGLHNWVKSRKSAILLAEYLGIESYDEKLILEQLQQVSVDELFTASKQIRDDFCIGNLRAFGPVIEKPSKNSFLCQEPLQIIKSGKYNKLPLMMGYTSREGMFIYLSVAIYENWFKDEFLIPSTMNVRKGSPLYKDIAKRIMNFYFGESTEELESNADVFQKLFTHNYFFMDMYNCAKRHVEASTVPVYFYRFSLDTDLNLYKRLAGGEEEGACHADDLGYLFTNDLLPAQTPHSPEDVAVRKVTTLWTNFAKFEQPTPREEELLDYITWRPVAKDVFYYLDIGEKLKLEVDPEKEVVNFWNELSKISKVSNNSKL